MPVYAPVWFYIKTKPKCYNGSVHLHKLIKLSRYLPAYLKKIVDPVLQRNAYFAHPENILICMLCDDRARIRELAVQRILAAVARSKLKEGIRVFRVPKINLNAKDYTNLIDWKKVNITEPPLTSRLSEQELRSLYKNKHLINLPCHTQAVERC